MLPCFLSTINIVLSWTLTVETITTDCYYIQYMGDIWWVINKSLGTRWHCLLSNPTTYCGGISSAMHVNMSKMEYVRLRPVM